MFPGTALLNGFGRTIGDSIMGLQALEIALELGALPQPVVGYRLSGFSPLLPEIYALASDLLTIRDLPHECATPDIPFPPAQDHAHVIDIRDFAFDPAFRGIAMVDYFLRKLGVDPATVPGPSKRNRWLEKRLTPRRRNDVHGNYVLICPKSSTPLRDMPGAVQQHIVGWLKERGQNVRTQKLPATLSMPGVVEERQAANFADLCSIVASAKAIVSTDTAMIHLADAFAVPCLAFFVTHRPEWRVRDYPKCVAVYRPAPELEPAMEFFRDERDIEAAQRAWMSDPDFAWLNGALDGFFRQFRV
ncbi:MAG TPA: glycosyltransferase family 9 protein [Reyranella sp.]|nr:glycosyltransferase family 9 protein [Reyranella sp.]